MVDFDDATHRLYVDNKQVAVVNLFAGATNSTSSPVTLGYLPDPFDSTMGSRFFAGELDDVRFYGRALAPNDVGELMALGNVLAVNENPPIGAIVGAVRIDDPQLMDQLEFRIADDRLRDFFEIDNENGNIIVANNMVLDAELFPWLVLPVEVRQNGAVVDEVMVVFRLRDDILEAQAIPSPVNVLALSADVDGSLPPLLLVSPASPGDANRDGRFDQLDVVSVLQGAKNLTRD